MQQIAFERVKTIEWQDRIVLRALFFGERKELETLFGKPSDKKTLHAQYKMLTTQQMQLRKEHDSIDV